MSLTTFTGPVVSQNGFLDSSFTTAERDAIVDPQPGLLIYNTTDNVYEVCTVGGATPTWDTAFGGGGAAPQTFTADVDYSTPAISTAGNTNLGFNNLSNALFTAVNANAAAGKNIVVNYSGGSFSSTVTNSGAMGTSFASLGLSSMIPVTAEITSFALTPPPPPNITSVSPSSGQAGATVIISGTGFTGFTSITFNGVSASLASSPTDTTLYVTAPSGLTGAVDITVTTPSGSSTEVNAFTYVVPTTTTYTQGGNYNSGGLQIDGFGSGTKLIVASSFWYSPANATNLTSQGSGTQFTVVVGGGGTYVVESFSGWYSYGPGQVAAPCFPVGPGAMFSFEDVTSITFTA